MGKIRTFNLADLFAIAAETVPEREALVCGPVRRSYRELEQRIERLAAYLRAKGVGPGDTVGLQMYNSAEYLEGFFAACKIRAVPFNVNYRYVSDELRYLYANAGIKALIYGASLEDRVQGGLPAAGGLKALLRVGPGSSAVPAEDYDKAIAAAPPWVDDIPLADDDISLLYTGGTTGMPKGVMWPHKSLFYASLGGGGLYAGNNPIEQPDQLPERINASYQMRNLPVAPLMHGAALWATLIWLYAGHTVILDDANEFNAERIWDLVVRENVNSIAIVGDAMAVPLLDALKAHPGRWDLAQVFNLSSGGAVFSAHVKEAIKAFLPDHAMITDAMGSSEGGQIGLGSRSADGGLLSIPPRPDVTVLVDRTRLAAPGETGIMARSGNLPAGYYGDPVKTVETFVTIDGQRYAVTGDAARLEADGSVTVFGRGSNCINSGGEKVFPEEVEEVVRKHDGIADVLVVGVSDQRWGQKVVAVISLRPGASVDAEELRRHCREHLANYKVPKECIFVDKVVRSPAGKADYRWAKATADARLGGGT
jgi:fatty-acyl-CoA synthase